MNKWVNSNTRNSYGLNFMYLDLMPVGTHIAYSEPKHYDNFFFPLKQMPCYFQGLLYVHFQQCKVEMSGDSSKPIYEEGLVLLNW